MGKWQGSINVLFKAGAAGNTFSETIAQHMLADAGGQSETRPSGVAFTPNFER